MEEATLKIELHDRIEHADPTQLRELYGLVDDYFSSQIVIGSEWDLMPEPLKKKIEKALDEAETDIGTPAKEVIKRTREKYGLNG